MNITFKSVIGLGVIAGIAALAPLPVHADQVTYLFTGIVTGTVSGTSFTNPNTPFTNALLDLTSSADTSGVTSSNGAFTNQVSKIGVGLLGVGFGSSTDTFRVVDNQTIPAAELIDNLSSTVYALKDPVFAAYDLKSTIGPVFASFYGAPFPAPLNTSFGTITFTSITNPTFTAIVGPAVPEASTVVSLGLLLTLGLGGSVMAARKRKA